MIEENNKTLPCTGNKTFLDKYTCQHRSENTTSTVSRKYIQGIIDT